MEKEPIARMFKKFLDDTEQKRLTYSTEHDIPSIREATFQDFLEWLEI